MLGVSHMTIVPLKENQARQDMPRVSMITAGQPAGLVAS